MQRSEYSLTPASESSSVGMQRSEPSLTPRQVESLKQSSATPQSRCGLGCCATHLDGVPSSAASESSSVGMQRSEPSLTPRQVESLKQSSDTPQPGCGLTSTPSVMVSAGEPMVISPPKLELGDEPPSKEALEVECAVVVRIADADNNDTLPCGATGDSARKPDEEDKDTPYFQLDEDEDYNFGFLNERDEGDQDEGDTSDDEDDATPNPDAEGGASAAQESGEACVFSAEEAMAMAAVVGYPVLLKTSEGTAGVLKVQCAEQI